MTRRDIIPINVHEEHKNHGSNLKDFILGWQDGLVNVLGVILGVAAATNDLKIVIIAGLAATFAESISMGAVAFTSSKAARDYYKKEKEREEREIELMPEKEREEVRRIYYNKGFRGKELENIVKKLTSNKEVWIETMMSEELRLFSEEYENPLKDGLIVGFSAVFGSLIPLFPFFFTNVKTGIILSLAISIISLFIAGVVKAKITIGNIFKEGFEMAAIGTLSALAGYGIGVLLGATYVG